MLDYSNNIIYKIINKNMINDENNKNFYVGHTCLGLIPRFYRHRSMCRNITDRHFNMPLYQFIRNNGDIDNWQIIEIERYPCNNNKEAEQRERYYIELLQPTLNKIIPTRTAKERYYLNRNEILQKKKEYYLKKKSIIKEDKI